MEDSAVPQSAGTPEASHGNAVKYARPALIVGAAIAVVCVALLVIIFFLDSLNAAVYSVDDNNIGDATDEARDIRELYSPVRIGGIVCLVVAVLAVAASSIVLYRNRKLQADEDSDDGEDVDFEDLAGR